MKKKIVLRRETVLALTHEQREQAVGGTIFTFGCPSRGCSNNSCDICHEN